SHPGTSSVRATVSNSTLTCSVRGSAGSGVGVPSAWHPVRSNAARTAATSARVMSTSTMPRPARFPRAHPARRRYREGMNATGSTAPSGRLGVDERAHNWRRLGDEEFDVLVIGGGVGGGGTAPDAAPRGLRVPAVEARHQAPGTSSRSRKLFHRGLRSQEQLEFGLVREGLRERELMLTRLAPH